MSEHTYGSSCLISRINVETIRRKVVLIKANAEGIKLYGDLINEGMVADIVKAAEGIEELLPERRAPDE